MARVATVDKMVEAIRKSNQPALTKQDIANFLDVTWQTIDNHEGELDADPRVESGQIGKARVFWLVGADSGIGEIEGPPLADEPGSGRDTDRSDENDEHPGEKPPEPSPSTAFSFHEQASRQADQFLAADAITPDEYEPVRQLLYKYELGRFVLAHTSRVLAVLMAIFFIAVLRVWEDFRNFDEGSRGAM